MRKEQAFAAIESAIDWSENEGFSGDTAEQEWHLIAKGFGVSEDEASSFWDEYHEETPKTS